MTTFVIRKKSYLKKNQAKQASEIHLSEQDLPALELDRGLASYFGQAS